MWVGIEVKSEIAGSTNPQLRLNTMIYKGFRMSGRPNRSRNLVAFGALKVDLGMNWATREQPQLAENGTHRRVVVVDTYFI